MQMLCINGKKDGCAHLPKLARVDCRVTAYGSKQERWTSSMDDEEARGAKDVATTAVANEGRVFKIENVE